MSKSHKIDNESQPCYRLPREMYLSEQWFQREQRELFGKCWAFAGVSMDFKEKGDFRTVQAGPYSLIVVRDTEGVLRAFHNICRHRGTELLEGCGNTGRMIVCPYHNWAFNLDGGLRAIPAQRECFPGLDKNKNALFPASVGVFRDLVFVHPESDQEFTRYCAGIDKVVWPHDIAAEVMEEQPDEIVYEMKCNWKVFFENAVDGYHLSYLHKNTLGGPAHDKNVWEAFGQNLVWWSIERDGVKHRIGKVVEQAARGYDQYIAPGGDQLGYGGVYIFFPTTILIPTPWGFSLSLLEPVNAATTRLRIRDFSPKGWLNFNKYRAADIQGYDPDSGLIKSENWKVHPLEADDFQTEDVWVCEKVQRAMASPRHQVGQLAKGSGGEATLEFFHKCVLDYVSPEMDMN